MANTLFIIEDQELTDLPKIVRDKAVSEVKRLFAFNAKLNVVISKPGQIPARIDFTDSIVKIVNEDGDVGAVENEAVRIQLSNLIFSARAHGIAIQTPKSQHTGAAPDRGGIGFQVKQVLAAGNIKFAFSLTGGVASVESAKDGVVEFLSDGESRADVIQRQNKQIEKRGLTRYYASHQALIDTRELAIIELSGKNLADWEPAYQEDVGIALGRIMAHEARHQYVLPHFNGGGLGADSPHIFGDKNFEQFDKNDQKEITTMLGKLAAEQRKATIHLETFPAGRPFPF